MKYVFILWLNNGTEERFFYATESGRDKAFDDFWKYNVNPIGCFKSEDTIIPHWAISKIKKENKND